MINQEIREAQAVLDQRQAELNAVTADIKSVTFQTAPERLAPLLLKQQALLIVVNACNERINKLNRLPTR